MVSKHSFLPYDRKPMASWWETPIWKDRCKSDENLVSKHSCLPYDRKRWFLDEKLQFETTDDVNAMYFWSLNTRFLPYDGKPMVSWWETPFWNNGCKTDVLLVSKHSFLSYDRKPMVSCWETPIWNNGCKSDVLLVSKDSFLPYDGKPIVSWWETPIWNTGCKSDELLVSKQSFLPYCGKLMVSWWEIKFELETTDVKAMYFWSLNTMKIWSCLP